VPLAPYTTLGLGGAARYFTECLSVDAIRHALDTAAEKTLPVQVLGGGSNTIFADAGFPGLVMRVALDGLAFDEERGAATVTAGAGVEWDALVREVVGRGLTGIECLAGIPGLVGATPMQNVGAYGQEIAQTLVRVKCLDRMSGREMVFGPADCRFGYRTSRFKRGDRDRYVILEVTLRLLSDARPTVRYAELARVLAESGRSLDTVPPAEAVRRVRATVLALRRKKSMVLDPADPNARSAGSFFLNPVIPRGEYERLQAADLAAGGTGIPSYPAPGGVKLPAAWLVEHAGFHKGLRRGGVGISSHHALALVNAGGSTAELLALAAEIEQAVAERFGIHLEREPVLVE